MSAIVGMFAVLFGLGDQALAALAGVAQTASANATLMGGLDMYVQGTITWTIETGATALQTLSDALAGVGGLIANIVGML